MELHNEPGWYGSFTREDAHGARFKAGARIKKTLSETGDATPTGMTGTVLGSIQAPTYAFAFYFVEWDDRPRIAVGVIEPKIGPA